MPFPIKILFFSFFFVSAFSEENIPSKNALVGDQTISNIEKQNKANQMLPEEQVLSKIDEKEIEKIISIAQQSKTIEMPEKKENLEEGQFQKTEITEAEAKKITELFQQQMSENGEVSGKNDLSFKTKGQDQRKKEKIKNKNFLTKKIEEPKKSGVSYFSFQIRDQEFFDFVSLPSGSVAVGKMGAGIEVSGEKILVDIILDHILLGPNKTAIDLIDCRVWASVYGNYNTDRLMADAEHVSCRGEDGKSYQVNIKGQLRDYEDEYVGVKASFLAKGKLAQALLQFLQGGVKGFGAAMAATGISSQGIQGNATSGPLKVDNVSDQQRYISGKSIEAAAGGFLDWWITYYKSLSPTLAVPPGRKVYFAITDTVEIPKSFFMERDFNTKNSIKMEVKNDN